MVVLESFYSFEKAALEGEIQSCPCVFVPKIVHLIDNRWRCFLCTCSPVSIVLKVFKFFVLKT